MPAAPSGRVRSLDGLRACAICLVLLAHLPRSLAATHPSWRPALEHLAVLGVLGVRVFFVISGFLISTLLMAEIRKTGTVSLRKFYFRRTLRIFPAFYCYVGVIALAAALGWLSLRAHDVRAAMTYTTNYHRDRSWYLGHPWSLSVEEQFYLLWPLGMKRLGIPRALTAAGIVVVLAPLVRVATSVFFPSARPGIGETFFTVADSVAIGCLLAGFRERLLASPRYVALLASPLFWALPVVVIVTQFVPYALASWLVGETVANLGILLMVHGLIDVRQGLAVRALNFAPTIFIGTLSYSIYLWQQPFLYWRADLPITHFPLNVLSLAAATLASYFLIERPFLTLRQWLETRAWSSKEKALAPVPVRPL